MPTQPPSPRHRPPSRTIFLASIVELVAPFRRTMLDCDRCGRLAQWESASFTRKRPQVRYLYRPPIFQRLPRQHSKNRNTVLTSLRPSQSTCDAGPPCLPARRNVLLCDALRLEHRSLHLSPVPARLALGESPYRNKGPGKGH